MGGSSRFVAVVIALVLAIPAASLVIASAQSGSVIPLKGPGVVVLYNGTAYAAEKSLALEFEKPVNVTVVLAGERTTYRNVENITLSAGEVINVSRPVKALVSVVPIVPEELAAPIATYVLKPGHNRVAVTLPQPGCYRFVFKAQGDPFSRFLAIAKKPFPDAWWKIIGFDSKYGAIVDKVVGGQDEERVCVNTKTIYVGISVGVGKWILYVYPASSGSSSQPSQPPAQNPPSGGSQPANQPSQPSNQPSNQPSQSGQPAQQAPSSSGSGSSNGVAHLAAHIKKHDWKMWAAIGIGIIAIAIAIAVAAMHHGHYHHHRY